MSKEQEYNLKLILLAGREKKGYSQRKLAKKIGIHHSSLNDLENGKIKNKGLKKSLEILEELKYLVYQEYDTGMYTITLN